MRNSKSLTRRIFGEVHLWLGIVSGLVLFIICLSGAVYTFRSEFEQLADPDKYMVDEQEGAEVVSVDRVIELLSDSGEVTSVLVPGMEQRTLEAVVKMSPEQRRGTIFYVHPYSGDIVGKSGGKAGAFFLWVMKLHRWLLMGKTGKVIVGVSTLIFVILVISGLVLWVPKKLRMLKNGLRITLRGTFRRNMWELHNVLGFYAAPILLIMALTGLAWSFDWYRSGLGNVLGAPVFNRGGTEKVEMVVPENSSKLPYADLLAKAKGRWDDNSDFRISVVQQEDTPVRITRYATGFFAFAGSDQMSVHPYTSEVLAVNLFSDRPLNEQIASLIKPLHTGEIYGTFSKIIYFFVVLIATSLPVTGVVMWLGKIRLRTSK
ncbi:PepSY domain-containing protein [Marinilabilia salmonicolor]|jgi:uncharacterized iron-regulated membrane protein|uniref:Putative iron-regulated membrane protein n=1 Tax=Marinilabilia salmonicolor TaxID=989 RepID=A0A2T0XBP0_9BACT|nr:PepSY-associated TM helix domain-containing protein [Marinilabilia salmonicolor]PRY96363.1 putative iron-regulated membrane protein [Marinilabilia salmonicolor]RCW37538.1 putative iron-regulated membrane protein [Marinilabilia salmonicolor]